MFDTQVEMWCYEEDVSESTPLLRLVTLLHSDEELTNRESDSEQFEGRKLTEIVRSSCSQLTLNSELIRTLPYRSTRNTRTSSTYQKSTLETTFTPNPI